MCTYVARVDFFLRFNSRKRLEAVCSVITHSVEPVEASRDLLMVIMLQSNSAFFFKLLYVKPQCWFMRSQVMVFYTVIKV